MSILALNLTRDKVLLLNVSDNTGQFKIIKKNFTQQFSQIYFARLQALRPIILKKIASQNESLHIGRVLDVEEGMDSHIVGTIFCDNIDRPNVFDEVENDQISNHKFSRNVKLVKEKLVLFLEDESGRIELDISRFGQYPWVTGTTVGLRGSADSHGKFLVAEIIEPGIPRLVKIHRASDSKKSSKYVALVSGLNYGQESAEYSLERSQLIDFLNGSLHSNFGFNIAKLIIIGNTMSAPIKISNEFKKKYGHEIAKYKVDHLHQIDRELSSLSKSIDLELMPGEDDLSNVALPQNPIPKAMFPSLSKIQNVNFTTNPCMFEIDSLKFLGSSGQNIDDLFRHVHTDNRIEIAEKTLAWRNIAPTAPDSLYCYPFYEKDPFVINETPHVYFIGNQPIYDTKLIEVEGDFARIVLIPEFSKCRTIVLVNTQDLSTVPVKIKV